MVSSADKIVGREAGEPLRTKLTNEPRRDAVISLCDQRLHAPKAVSQLAHLAQKVQIHAVLRGANKLGELRSRVALRGQLVEEREPDVVSSEECTGRLAWGAPTLAWPVRPESSRSA